MKSVFTPFLQARLSLQPHKHGFSRLLPIWFSGGTAWINVSIKNVSHEPRSIKLLVWTDEGKRYQNTFDIQTRILQPNETHDEEFPILLTYTGDYVIGIKDPSAGKAPIRRFEVYNRTTLIVGLVLAFIAALIASILTEILPI